MLNFPVSIFNISRTVQMTDSYYGIYGKDRFNYCKLVEIQRLKLQCTEHNYDVHIIDNVV